MRKTFVMAWMLLFAFALTAAAKERIWVKLYNTGTINGAQLKPGEYRMEVNVQEQEAVFYKGRKEVARSAVRQEDVSGKYDRDSVVYQGETITEIRQAGKSSKLILSPGPVASKTREKSPKSNNY